MEAMTCVNHNSMGKYLIGFHTIYQARWVRFYGIVFPYWIWCSSTI